MKPAKGIVLQSHQSPLPHPWLDACIDSVRRWSDQQNMDYLFIHDELFSRVPADIMDKTCKQKVIATDLARLLEIRSLLQQGYNTVVWCDADLLIFNPQNFVLPESSYALGREVWIQSDSGKLKAYRKVHNAFLMFRQGNHFLDFYIDTATRLLRLNIGSMPSQFIGPKLLSALHNIIVCPVMETAGMLSPPVIMDIVSDGSKALKLFLSKSEIAPAAANLCCSSISNQSVTDADMARAINKLLSEPGFLLH